MPMYVVEIQVILYVEKQDIFNFFFFLEESKILLFLLLLAKKWIGLFSFEKQSKWYWKNVDVCILGVFFECISLMYLTFLFFS